MRAATAWGACGLGCVRLQLGVRAAAAWGACGYSLGCVRLQLQPVRAAWGACGGVHAVGCMRLAPHLASSSAMATYCALRSSRACSRRTTSPMRSPAMFLRLLAANSFQKSEMYLVVSGG